MILPSLRGVSAEAWNAIAGTEHPFVRYEFLAALEQHNCLLPYGWQPAHVLVHQGRELVGALPLYLKSNSYGEFVFDWAWASAYKRLFDKSYYPKLVSTIPYTPATGPRLLIAPHVERQQVATQLTQEALALAQKLQASSLHYLFTDETELRFLVEQQGLLARSGCQFHWHNQGYRDFDDYLQQLTAKKRNQIRRERRQALSWDITIEILNGYQATAEHWQHFHEFYQSTFARKSGLPTLSLAFFQAIGQQMPEQIVLVMAHQQGHYVAGALNLRSAQTLYGRHWGCRQHFRYLHFELCYYQTLEYCIQKGLQRFEAGAQGEHKLSRGFLPYTTWSAHWLADERFAQVVQTFLEQERFAVQAYVDELYTHSPFKQIKSTL